MNRTATILIVTAGIAATAGWAAARTRAHYRERNAARAEAQATEERLTKPAREISALLAGADEVVFIYGGFAAPHKREIRLRDPEWIRRFAAITGRARYTQHVSIMATSFPVITFYRKQERVVSVMGNRVLGILDRRDGVEFIVSDDVYPALHALVREVEAAHPQS